jgi:hypothetical protein
MLQLLHYFWYHDTQETCTHKTIILSVVFFGYEALSLILREEHTLRMFEYRALRIIAYLDVKERK